MKGTLSVIIIAFMLVLALGINSIIFTALSALGVFFVVRRSN